MGVGVKSLNDLMPRKKVPPDVRSLARIHTALAVNTLAGVARSGESEAAKVSAAIALMDRGWGRAPQTLAGEDGEGNIEITIRHILGEKKK